MELGKTAMMIYEITGLQVDGNPQPHQDMWRPGAKFNNKKVRKELV